MTSLFESVSGRWQLIGAKTQLMEIIVSVSSYEFACLIEEQLRKIGIEKIGADIGDGIRNLYFREDIPRAADFIPSPIDVNLPDILAG